MVFSERGQISQELKLPCGQCIGCRVQRAQGWAIRCMHEAQMHEVNSFVTLTYNDDNIQASLRYSDFQLFMKRLRKVNDGKVRFFCAGEYDDNLRPHFHALLFGCRFPNAKEVGKELYRSAELERLWPHGFSSFGSVTYASAAYVARYALKKITGPSAPEHYERVDVRTGELVQCVPEFCHMSLKPGIGRAWFDRYWRDVYMARDAVVVKGKLHSPPRYYDHLLASLTAASSMGIFANDPLEAEKELDRYTKSERFKDDCTPERLLVRESVMKARMNLYQRS